MPAHAPTSRVGACAPPPAVRVRLRAVALCLAGAPTAGTRASSGCRAAASAPPTSSDRGRADAVPGHRLQEPDVVGHRCPLPRRGPGLPGLRVRGGQLGERAWIERPTQDLPVQQRIGRLDDVPEITVGPGRLLATAPPRTCRPAPTRAGTSARRRGRKRGRARSATGTRPWPPRQPRSSRAPSSGTPGGWPGRLAAMRLYSDPRSERRSFVSGSL